jgi:hypothetical protein
MVTRYCRRKIRGGKNRMKPTLILLCKLYGEKPHQCEQILLNHCNGENRPLLSNKFPFIQNP